MRSLGDGISDPGEEPDDAHDAVLTTMRRTVTGRIFDSRVEGADDTLCRPARTARECERSRADLTRRTCRVSWRREPPIEPVEGRRRGRDADHRGCRHIARPVLIVVD